MKFAYFARVMCGVFWFATHGSHALPYTTLDKQCDGLPALPLVTMERMCVGLVAQKSHTTPFKMPRTLIELADGKLLVVDMVSWSANAGKLWLVDYKKPEPTATAVMEGLHLPFKIRYGPKGKIYLSEANRIQRFDWRDGKINQLETVVGPFPWNAEYLHPLKNFAFDPQGNLLVNIGSASDHCNNGVEQKKCIDGAEASVRRYGYDQANDSWDPNFEIVARGLRNSMVLAVHPSGTILQAENSMDFPDADEPYEEINILEAGKFYGWPLCYNRTASLTGGKCSAPDYQEPWTLLPPHTAPLDAFYYRHDKLPALDNMLLMGWHGYRIAGNRLVAYKIDSLGRPVRQDAAIFWRAPQVANGHYTAHDFAPRGSLGPVAQHLEIISGWNDVAGLRPEGAPVGLTQARDGSVFIVDDRNSAILRLSNGEQYRPDKRAAVASKTPKIIIPDLIEQTFKMHCAQCHLELVQEPETLLTADKWLRKSEGKSVIEQRVLWDRARPMPPQVKLTETELEGFRNWFQHLR